MWWRRVATGSVAVAAAALVAVACGAAGDAGVSTVVDQAPPETIALTPVGASTVVPTTAVPVTAVSEPPTVKPATTLSTPTSVATTPVPTTPVPTTEPATTTPSTTSAPTTTAPPETTIDPLAGFETVAPSPVPIPAVGKSSGDGARLVQQRLLELKFWHAGVDGQYGHTTQQAVMAFQKYNGLEATGAVDEATAAMLTAMPIKARASLTEGTFVEVDKRLQLLFIVRDGITVWVLNTSTGNGQPYEEEDKNSPGEFVKGVSLTPDGYWKVNRERAEGWWEGDLGEIYRPKYFKGGVAVHGSNSIPAYPASHGCVRVSVPAMDFIWQENLMPMGTVVWVHG